MEHLFYAFVGFLAGCWATYIIMTDHEEDSNENS